MANDDSVISPRKTALHQTLNNRPSLHRPGRSRICDIDALADFGLARRNVSNCFSSWIMIEEYCLIPGNSKAEFREWHGRDGRAMANGKERLAELGELARVGFAPDSFG